MIPILFPADTTDFSTNGLGRLAETYQCKVTEERNGEYELSMKYPTSGKLFSEIQNESIIVAVPYYGAEKQAFRIYNKKPDSKYQCIISARHISYDANYIPIKPFTAAGIQDTVSKLNFKVNIPNDQSSEKIVYYQSNVLSKYRFYITFHLDYVINEDQMEVTRTPIIHLERDEDASRISGTVDGIILDVIVNGSHFYYYGEVIDLSGSENAWDIPCNSDIAYTGVCPAEESGPFVEPISYSANVIINLSNDEPLISNQSNGQIILNRYGKNGYNLEANPFTIDTDIENETSPYTQNYPRSLRACLGGDDGSLLDVFASRGTGEYEWDNYNIHFWNHRGSDRGYECRYAKNIISLEREIDSENLITGVVGMWQDPETEVYLYSDVQYADDKDTYKTNKTVVIDFSQDFDTTPTPAELNAAAKIYADTQCMLDDSIDLEFYDQTNQNVKLCDTIKVKFDKIGVDLKVKVIKTVWDVLLERYESITIGSLRSTLADTLYDQMQNVAEIAARYTDKTITSVKVTIDGELGEINTSIETVSSNINDLSSDINDQLNNEETGIIKLISDVDQKADSVSTTVSKIIEKGGLLDQAISTSQQTFADAWELSTIKQAVSENGQYIDEQQSYLRWDGEDGSVTIGKSDSNTKTRIDNEGYQVIVSGEVSWQADSEGSKNKKYMQAGRYKWVDEGDNGFSLIYV